MMVLVKVGNEMRVVVDDGVGKGGEGDVGGGGRGGWWLE